MMKVNMVVGGRYNAPPMAAALARLVDLRVYSSVTPSYWPGAESCVRVIPHLSMIYGKLTRRPPSRQFKDFSTQLFSSIASRMMRRDADVIYTWASFGREAMTLLRKRGSIALLDRACPHIRYQESVLSDEADALGVPFNRSDESFVQRCVDEYALADVIIVPSRYTQRTFLEAGFPESKVRLMTLGPNFEPRQMGRRCNPSNFTVGVVAGGVLRKGLRYLVTAWKGLNLPNATLRLKVPVGVLKQAPSLWNEIESCHSIEIVGYMKDLEDFYRTCDIFCLPSVDEGFGMVVFEAIACGCPTLVTKNVGAADIVREGETGFVVEARSAEALAERIQYAYNNRSRLQEMSGACDNFYREYKTSSFSFEKQVEQLVEDLKRRKG